jgi:glycosyltransferase involved in cell wall biosynthesis
VRIDFVNNQFHLGGAETVVKQLHFACRQAGHRSVLWVAEGKAFPRGVGVHPLYPRLLSRLYHTRFSSWVEAWAPRQAWTERAFRSLAARGSDLVHIHNFHDRYASIESLAHVAARKRVIWTLHGFWAITGGCDYPLDCTRYLNSCGQCPQVGVWPIGPEDRTAECLSRKLQHLSQAPIQVVAPSQYLARKVKESRVGKHWSVRYIPNGVNCAEFGHARKRDPGFRAALGLDPDATVILAVSRNFRDPYKKYSILLDALKLVNPVGAQLVLAGQSTDWAVSQLPAGWRCLNPGYVGSRQRMADLFEAADVFLFASVAENFPCVILEAMSSACCVVSTPTDGVVEQVVHGQSGLIAGAMTGEALARVLTEALSNADRRAACGRAARERVVREFSEARMIGEYLQLYGEVTGRPWT